MPISFGIKRADTGELSALRPKQAEFIAEQYKHRYNGAYGGWGSGKTRCLHWVGGAEILKRPGIRILCGHRDKTKAYRNLILGIRSVLPPPRDKSTPFVDNPNKADGIWEYGPHVNNPAIIVWMGLAEDTGQVEALRTMGDDFDLALISQAEQLTDEAFLAIRSRLGRRDVTNWPGFLPRALFDWNPQRGCWPHRRFNLHELDSGENPDDYYALHFSTRDNDCLPPEYIRDLENLPPSWRRRYFEGLDDDTSNLIYPTFDTTLHVVKHQEIPFQKSWLVCRALDRGYRPDPFGCIWYASDHDGNCFVVHEIERYELTIRQRVEAIRAGDEQVKVWMSGKCGVTLLDMPNVFGRVYGPPDLNTTNEALGKTQADLMLRDPQDPDWKGLAVDVVAIKGIGRLGEEQSGQFNIIELLKKHAGHPNPITGTPNAPRLYISDRCPCLIAQLTQATALEDKPEWMDMRRVRNPFGEPGQKHHWDLERCLRIAAQQFRTRAAPEPPKPLSLEEYLYPDEYYARQEMHYD